MQTEFRTFLWRRGLSIMLFVLFSMTAAMAQVLVKGTVIDKAGESVIGASIQVKGTTQGTITDVDGKLSLWFLLLVMPRKNSRWIPLNLCLLYWKKIRRYWTKWW